MRNSFTVYLTTAVVSLAVNGCSEVSKFSQKKSSSKEVIPIAAALDGTPTTVEKTAALVTAVAATIPATTGVAPQPKFFKLPASASFVFMDSSGIPKNSPYDYTNNQVQANSVISSLSKIGTSAYLIPALTDAETKIVATAIEANSGYFFTQERWSFEEAAAPRPNGSFNCEIFKAKRVIPYLIPLVKAYPKSFRGLHFPDEPSTLDLVALGDMAKCVRSVPELASLEIFLNLLPLATTWTGILNKTDITLLTPAQIGLDCEGGIIHQDWLTAHMDGYRTYVGDAVRLISPTYTAYDFYPYTVVWAGGGCLKAAEKIVAWNAGIIAKAATAHNSQPVAYMQNVCDKNEVYNKCASAQELRWASGINMAGGIKQYAYFVSHTFDNYYGLLDEKNVPTGLFAAINDWRFPIETYQEILNSSTFMGPVIPSIGIPSGSIIANLDNFTTPLSAEYTAGEYQGIDAKYIIISPRGYIVSGLWTQVVFNSFYTSVEQYNPPTGQYISIASGANTANVWFNWNQSVLLRLK